ncbi:hypothetical protein ACN9MZ_02505 [Pseudoduganella sp. S-14]|uniref:hypothetical protein n=1 Tax=Pseudoduganella sp. S-14 TaxID=3404065 RepID=UPI003CF4E98D
MKFESDDAKRQFVGSVAKICAERFSASNYPHRAFNVLSGGVPKELAYVIIELYIRMPAMGCLPKSLKPLVGHIPSRDEIFTMCRSCPAIESIKLHAEFQRYGFLNALMRELGRIGVPYVNISNIENHELALHYLNLSRDSRSGVELTSAPNTVSPSIRHPTFSFNLSERSKYLENEEIKTNSDSTVEPITHDVAPKNQLPVFCTSQLEITPPRTPEQIRSLIAAGRFAEMTRHQTGLVDDD